MRRSAAEAGRSDQKNSYFIRDYGKRPRTQRKVETMKTIEKKQTTRSDDISLDSLNVLGMGRAGCGKCGPKSQCNCVQLEYLKNLAHKNVESREVTRRT